MLYLYNELTCFAAKSLAFAMQIYEKSCRNPRGSCISTVFMLIGIIQLGLMCQGSIDNGGSLDIMRFVHFTKRTRTAFAVEQLIS